MSTLREELEHRMDERILVLDGAMGTLIQTHELGESHFRGDGDREFHPPNAKN